MNLKHGEKLVVLHCTEHMNIVLIIIVIVVLVYLGWHIVFTVDSLLTDTPNKGLCIKSLSTMDSI